MMFYTDIHCHMLGGVDDGARDTAQMLEMLDAAYESGTRAICLTPHFNPAYFGDTSAVSESVFAQLHEYASERYADMRLYLGNELFYYDGCVNALVSGACRTLNGTRYVLVDFNFDTPFLRIRAALRDLLSSGYIPVFAHVERYECIKPPFRELMELREMGIKIQINSTSLCGGWGRGIQKKTVKLLKKYIPDVLASDAHSTGTRHPRLDECESIVSELCGNDYADAIMHTEPSKIIGIN
ncbi:MAG: hypothetical protein IJY27_06710 [Clostridia bacterium]|nr:hypothetical protein [Clostridia bacterium]